MCGLRGRVTFNWSDILWLRTGSNMMAAVNSGENRMVARIAWWQESHGGKNRMVAIKEGVL
jgi:hypothetical protein